jgi:DNA-binding transcriptional MerR regulator
MKKAPEAFRTISEVAEILETPAHVLRFWESKFYQIRPVKRAGGRRYYRPDDVALINGIRGLLQDQGMTIRGVQRVLQDQGVKHVAALGMPLPVPSADGDLDGTMIEADLDGDFAAASPDGQSRVPEHAADHDTAPVAGEAPETPASETPALETPAAKRDVQPEIEPEPEFDVPDFELAEFELPELKATGDETNEADTVRDTLPAPDLENADAAPKPRIPEARMPEIPAPDMDSADPVPGHQNAPDDEDAMSESDALEPPAFADARQEPPVDTASDTLLAATRHKVPVGSDPLARDTQTAPDGVTSDTVGDETPLPDRARIAQTLRSLPRGRLGPRKDALQLAARRIDTLLERMSEASGAGRW